MVLRLMWIILAIVGGIVLLWLVPLKIIWRVMARLGISPPCPAAFASLVDNRVRRRWMGRVLERVGIEPGERVLELGPGPGAFTVEAARRLGPEGRLIAVDIQPKMIALVEQRVREHGLANVETHVASAYEMPLDDGSVDRAYLVTVLPEIPDQVRALRELRRVLRPSGRLAITEEFPDPDYRFAFETVRRVEAAGFRLDKRFGNVWVYTLIFRKDERVAQG